VEEKYIALAIPFFFLLIGVELLVNRAQGDVRYDFRDSITNLSCGVGQQILEPFLKATSLVFYAWLWDHARIATIPPTSIVAWVVLLFGVDLGYYVFHRASHRVGVLWALHVVHHQSEEYNLSVALRQSWFELLVSPLFYLPLAVIGFSPVMYVGMKTINTLYQFWIHTRAIGRLGPLEWILNTPSHHRVHHGKNPKYLDKNYAGMFIIWDRLFGSFVREDDEPVYGTVKPLASYNPLWANVAYWVDMARMAKAARSWRDKAFVWLAPPEWRPRDQAPVVIPEVTRAAQRKYAPARAPRGLSVYVGVQFAIIATATSAYLFAVHAIPLLALTAAATVILVTVVAWGALFERRAWAWPLEVARLAAGAALCAWLAHGSTGFALVAAVAGAAAVAFGVWVLRYRPHSGEGIAEPART
jgi:sterol desaturase/sphingolipid hydroxylase (fatty acid hydroxylase superfamily)